MCYRTLIDSTADSMVDSFLPSRARAAGHGGHWVALSVVRLPQLNDGRAHCTSNVPYRPLHRIPATGIGNMAEAFYENEDNLKKLCDFLRGKEGPAVREAIEMDKRVYYLKGESRSPSEVQVEMRQVQLWECVRLLYRCASTLRGLRFIHSALISNHRHPNFCDPMALLISLKLINIDRRKAGEFPRRAQEGHQVAVESAPFQDPTGGHRRMQGAVPVALYPPIGEEREGRSCCKFFSVHCAGIFCTCDRTMRTYSVHHHWHFRTSLSLHIAHSDPTQPTTTDLPKQRI